MPVLSKFAALSSIDWDYGDVVEFTARARAVLAESYNILTIIPVRKTTRFLKLSWDFENMWWRLYRFTGHFLLANGILTGHFLYGDRGIKDLCGRFPPTDSEKYLMTPNRSNFRNEVRQSCRAINS